MSSRTLPLLLVALSLTACAGYEAAKSTDFATLPTATVRFAAASGITANLQILDSAYRGSLGTAASCGQDFNGCYPLAGGSGGGQNLCPGEWYLGSQALLFDTTDVACGGVPLAECSLGTSSGNVQSFSPGSNPVAVLCTAHGSDVVFDVTLCSGADCGACTPTTCAARGKNCGSMSDGCGATLNCGSCSGAQTCGGAGTANLCGLCSPTSCAAAGKDCGTMSDGCGATLTCGTCSGSATCGGTGAPGVCGTCPNTCSSLGKTCGSLSNGCGGTLSCGTCSGTEVCTANVCTACVPKTCTQLGATCGTVSDGCVGTLSCGTCTAPDVCGPANVCGQTLSTAFVPQTFAVTPGGTVLAVRLNSDTVVAQCLNADGSVLRESFTALARSANQMWHSLEVSTNRTGTRFVVNVSLMTPAANCAGWQALVLDGQCNQLSAIGRTECSNYDWEEPRGGIRIWDDGSFVAAQRFATPYPSGGGYQGSRLAFYDALGTPQAMVPYDQGPADCGSGGYGLNVAIRPGRPGTGVFTCQIYRAPVMMRRFAGRTWAEDAIDTHLDVGYVVNHLPGMNDHGDIVVVAYNQDTGGHWSAIFYPAGSTSVLVDLARAGSNLGYIGFGNGPPEIPLSGDDFLLRVSAAPAYRLFSPLGVLLESAAGAPVFNGNPGLLLDGSGSNYLLERGNIVKNSVVFQ